jgi:hypothetical protein
MTIGAAADFTTLNAAGEVWHCPALWRGLPGVLWPAAGGRSCAFLRPVLTPVAAAHVQTKKPPPEFRYGDGSFFAQQRVQKDGTDGPPNRLRDC